MHPAGPDSLTAPMSNLSVTQAGYNKLWVCVILILMIIIKSFQNCLALLCIWQFVGIIIWFQGQENYDLLQSRNILPPEKVEAPKIRLTADFQNSVNCSPDIFRCTLTRIPETDSLLKKSRLPLGVLIHPFRDLHVSSKYLPFILFSVLLSLSLSQFVLSLLLCVENLVPQHLCDDCFNVKPAGF